MSLDDTTATEYHGPDAVRWFHPDGRTLSLSPSQWERAQRKLLALTADEQYAYDRKRKAREAEARIVDGEIHKPAATMESLLAEEMAKPLTVYPRHDTGVITLDNIQTDPIYDITRKRCVDHPYSWHYADHGDCASFDEELLRVDAFTSLPQDATPGIWRNLADKIVQERQQDADDTARAVRAERDSAQEGERFWRRLAYFASAACVVGTGINILNATGVI